MPDPVIQAFGTLLGTMAYKDTPEYIQEKVIDAIEAYSLWLNERKEGKE